MGATCTSVVPVYDGFALTQGIVRFPIGGEFLVGEARRYLESLGSCSCIAPTLRSLVTSRRVL